MIISALRSRAFTIRGVARSSAAAVRVLAALVLVAGVLLCALAAGPPLLVGFVLLRAERRILPASARLAQTRAALAAVSVGASYLAAIGSYLQTRRIRRAQAGTAALVSKLVRKKSTAEPATPGPDPVRRSTR